MKENKLAYVASGSSTEEEHLPHNPKVADSSLTTNSEHGQKERKCTSLNH